jgi:hypothetical protein
MEKLVECKRCSGNACYEQQLIEQNVTTWLCMGCGFTTSTLMVKGSKVVNDAIETAPELYKDLMYEDQSGNVWLPSTITLPAKGMVFIDGVNKTNWKWAAAKAVEILEEEKSKYPEGQTHKMDMKNIKHFEQKDFMDALETIGFFAV